MRDKDPKINDLAHALSYNGINTTAGGPGSHTLTVNNGNATGQYVAGKIRHGDR
jgi:hypothetical protein